MSRGVKKGGWGRVRRPKFMGQILAKIATPINVYPIYSFFSPRQLPRASEISRHIYIPILYVSDFVDI